MRMEPTAANPAELADSLPRRVEELEAAKQYWKRTALVAITVGAVLLLGAVLITIGAGSVCYSAITRADAAERRADEEAQKARIEAQRAAVEEQRIQAIIETLRAQQPAPEPAK